MWPAGPRGGPVGSARPGGSSARRSVGRGGPAGAHANRAGSGSSPYGFAGSMAAGGCRGSQHGDPGPGHGRGCDPLPRATPGGEGPRRGGWPASSESMPTRTGRPTPSAGRARRSPRTSPLALRRRLIAVHDMPKRWCETGCRCSPVEHVEEHVLRQMTLREQPQRAVTQQRLGAPRRRSATVPRGGRPAPPSRPRRARSASVWWSS